MTARYLGMSRETGKTLSDAEHIAQSVRDILITPIGSRVQRRDYGSLYSMLIDQPQNDALELQLMAASYVALLKWEPRIRLSSITFERNFNGQMVINLEGAVTETGGAFSLNVPLG